MMAAKLTSESEKEAHCETSVETIETVISL